MLSPRKSFFRAPPLMAFALLAAFLLSACGELSEEREFYRRDQEMADGIQREFFDQLMPALPRGFGTPAEDHWETAVNSGFLEWLHYSYRRVERQVLDRHSKFAATLLESLAQGRRPPVVFYQAFRRYLREIAIPGARMLAGRAVWFQDYEIYGKYATEPVLARMNQLWSDYIQHAEATLAQLEKDQAKAEQNPSEPEKDTRQISPDELFAPAPFSEDAFGMPPGTVAPALTLAYLAEFKAFAERSGALHQEVLSRKAEQDPRAFFQERWTLARRVYALNMQLLLMDLDCQALMVEMFHAQAKAGRPMAKCMYAIPYRLDNGMILLLELLQPGHQLGKPQTGRRENLPQELRPDLEAIIFRVAVYENVTTILDDRLKLIQPHLVVYP